MKKWNFRSLITQKVICAGLVLFLAYLTYFKAFYEPKNLYYDELYYVAVAQKYISNYLQFEVHPPLGKLIIALGEGIFHLNKDMDITENVKAGIIRGSLPPDFNPAAFRYFPVLLSTLSSLLVFLIFSLLSRNNWLSLFFSMLYVFENAYIVNFRGALLDGTLMFFILSSLLFFLYIYEDKLKLKSWSYFVLGCLAGLAVSTKIVASILLLLFVFLYFKEFKKDSFIKLFFKRAWVYAAGLLLVCFSVYYIHVVLGNKTIPGYVGIASKEYLELVKNEKEYNPLNMYIPLRDNFVDMKRAHTMIDTVDLCKPGEIGSLPIGWPLGIKSINMLRETGGPKAKYLTIQGNPFNWLVGLTAVLLSLCLIISRTLFNTPIKNNRMFRYIKIFSALYVGYMTAIIWSATQRILYMHLYFIPLMFSFILALLMFNYFFEQYLIKKDKIVLISLVLFSSLIFYNYMYFKPLTYYEGITYEQCVDRRWFSLWGIYCEK